MRLTLYFFISILISVTAHAQYSYMIIATGNGNCPLSDSNTISGSFNGVSNVRTANSKTFETVLFSGVFSSPITSNLIINGSCPCFGEPGCVGQNTAKIDVPNYQLPLPTGPTFCYEDALLAGASGTLYFITARVIVYKNSLAQPQVSVLPGQCGQSVTLTTPEALQSYQWEASQGASAIFRTVKSTSNPSVSISNSDLVSAGFPTPSGQFFFRYKNPNCAIVVASPSTGGVQFNDAPPTASAIGISPSCNGLSDGKVQVNSITGPATSFRITLEEFIAGTFVPVFGNQIIVNKPFTTPIEFSNSTGHAIKGGAYQVRIENNSGNGSCYVTVGVTINDPPPFIINLNGLQTNVSCNSANTGPNTDGSLQLTLQNGAAPYSYQFNSGSGFNPITPDDASTLTPTLGGLAVGTYQFKATYQSNGVTCESNVVSGVTIDQPTPLSISSSQTQVLCLAKNRGEIDVTASGGNGGYTYAWSATGTYAPYSIPSVEDPTNLFAGDYSLTVTDSKGCSNAAPVNVSITEPALPVILNATVPSRALYGGFDMTCALNDGIIELDLENETLPVASYTWTKDGNPFTPTSFTFAEDLTPGVYDVTVIDGNNCDATQSITLNPHPGIIGITRATSSFNGFNTKCPDSNEGEGFVESVTNAFGTLSYTWFDGSTNQSIADLLPGNYAVNVIDGNGCSDDATLVIAPPPAIDPNIQITSNYNGESITCPGAMDGAMQAFPTNGFGSYSYLWDHGPTSAAISGLSQNTYAVTVTDDYGCSVRNELLISDPATMQLPLTKTSYNGSDLTCRDAIDGGIQLNVVNGIAPYAYAWSEGSTSQNISGLAAGDYSVTVTDQNGCTQTNSTTIINPDALLVDMQHINDFNGFDITCNGLADGSARAFLDGGTAPYRYIWDGGQTTEVISNQPAGVYTVTVLDANDCPNNGSIILIEPTVLEVEANVDIPVSCYEGSDAAISLAGTGGAGIYSYAMDGINYQAANQFGGLDFGTKDFYIRDGNGCVQQIQQKVPQPDPISIQFQNVVDALCNDPIGSALAAASGGNGGFSYQWFDEVSGADFNTGEMLQGAPASIYRVAVFDSKGCTSSDLVAVSSIGGASFDIDNISAVTCFGFDDGSASISVTSGAMPYSYSWSDGQSSIMASNLVAGSYFATVTDGLGCKTIKPVLIPSPPQLEANYNQKIPNCVGDCDGELEAIATGGTAPYTFNWVSLQTSNALITGLCSGEYDLEVTDANGCKIEELVALSDPEPLAITVNSTRPICLGNCGGAINAIGIGGTGPYLYQWENGPSSALYNDICPGEYTITMTDANGCQTTEVKTLLAGDPLPVDLGEDVTLCVGQNHELDAGEGWITVSWTSTNGFVASDPLVVVSEPGTYTVTATDATGCMGVDDFTLETSLDLLTAEFLVPAETVLGDTLVAVDVSWPLADRVEWKIPASFTRLPTESPNVLFAVPSESGDYIVGMESFLAACRDLAEKQIIILASEKVNVGGRLGYKDELVKQFSVFPNPNNGRFDVNLLLSEEREIKLQIISFPKGAIEVYYEGPSSDFHQVNFELTDLAQGMYLVLLTMDQEKRLIRFVKK